MIDDEIVTLKLWLKGGAAVVAIGLLILKTLNPGPTASDELDRQIRALPPLVEEDEPFVIPPAPAPVVDDGALGGSPEAAPADAGGLLAQNRKRSKATRASKPPPKGAIVRVCAGRVGFNNGRGPKMCLVPGGEFVMGSATERPIESLEHEMKVRGFLLDRTEVTVSQYGRCVAARSCEKPVAGAGSNWGELGRERHPMNRVNWLEASKFCEWARKRLPTEEEWEYAARGKASWRYAWGFIVPGPQLCWNGPGNEQGRGSRASTCVVGSYPAGRSSFGVDDLLGNVAEFTSSPPCYYDAMGSENCDSPEHVIRGGGWTVVLEEEQSAARRSHRSSTETAVDLGFRCARSIKQPDAGR